MMIGSGGITMRNEYRVGDLVRLVRLKSDSHEGQHGHIHVYFLKDEWELQGGWLPVHSVGMIIKLCSIPGSFHVLFGDRIILTSDSYIRPYDPADDLFIEYENYEGYISDMGAEE